MITQSDRIGLDRLGIDNLDNICYNFSSKKLVTDIVDNGEGLIGMRGAAMVDTGIYTGRSPKDKYIVDESNSSDKVWWGDVNRKISNEILELSGALASPDGALITKENISGFYKEAEKLGKDLAIKIINQMK